LSDTTLRPGRGLSRKMREAAIHHSLPSWRAAGHGFNPGSLWSDQARSEELQQSSARVHPYQFRPRRRGSFHISRRPITMSRMTLPADPSESARPSVWFADLAVLIYLAAATVIVHLLTGGRYGFHRDELATLDDARHLAWGYVAYPPVTPFFGWLSLKLFGTSLTGFRFFAAVSVSIAVVLTGLMARELGGSTAAQAL